MGQSCFSIMLAVNAPRTTKHEVADRIYNVASNYEEAPACLNENLLGIEIAVGGSGRGGAADFNYIVPLVAMDWLALANGIEGLAPQGLAPHDRPAIVALLVSLGMSERANPRVLAWAGLADP